MHTLACGPFFSTTGLFVSLFVLLVVKPLTYFAFIQAFRYRVARDVPMSFRRAVMLALARTFIGAALIVFVAFAAGLLSSASIAPSDYHPPILWGLLAAERLALWLCLGVYAGLRTRRLVGWTISGVCIDLAYDVAVGVTLADQWLLHAAILAAVTVFLVLLHLIGRRASLRARFDSSPRCTRCAYDLTANVSGVCPECGTPVKKDASGVSLSPRATAPVT
jgi:hypothetical protein